GSRFYRFRGFSGGGAAHFVILSGEKRRMLKNGLSEIMRTESKDLSAAEFLWKHHCSKWETRCTF
ncbi:MAG: hypothetical protein SOV30_07185, partial [Dialister sp.]|nr:hypothetical protein [Dialister sp.]